MKKTVLAALFAFMIHCSFAQSGGLGWVTNPSPGDANTSVPDACFDGNTFHAVTLTGRDCYCDWWKHEWHNDYPCPNSGNNDMVLVFEDDFNNINEDFWKVGYPWGGEIANAMSFGGVPLSSSQNVVTENGYLHLKALPQYVNSGLYGWDWANNPIPANNYWYTSGSITSNMHFGYGMYEIRAKMPENPNHLNSAFWLYGGCANEIDVFETFSDEGEAQDPLNHVIKSTVYSKESHCNDGDGDESRCSINFHHYYNSLNDWHIYTVIWTPTEIEFYVDGIFRSEITRFFRYDVLNGGYGPWECAAMDEDDQYKELRTFPTAANNTMQVVLGIGVRNGDIGPQEMIIDYVKVWQARECMGNTLNNCGTFMTNGAANADNSYVGNTINFSPSDCGWLLKDHTAPSGYDERQDRVVFAVASNEINLLPGFEVELGPHFSADIRPCNNNWNSRLTDNDDSPTVKNFDETGSVTDMNETVTISDLFKPENDDMVPSKDILLYPNPADKIISVKCPEKGTYEIISIDGKVLLNGEIVNHTSTINIESLPQKNMYLFRYTGINGESYSKRFIKE